MPASERRKLTSSLADSPVSPSPSSEGDREKKTSGFCGRNLQESSRKLDRFGLSLKTFLEYSIWQSTTCSPIWSLRATPQGRLYIRLRLSAPRTEGKECLSWPTPRASDANGCGPYGSRSQKKHVQKEKINWICGRSGKFSGRMWRTPDAHCDRGSCSDGKMQSKLSNKLPISINDQVRHSGNRGSLNPDWVECLMGFPIGWTDVSCEEPLPWPGWPAPAFEDQFEYEPPRTAENVRNRAKRLRCLGNAVVPSRRIRFSGRSSKAKDRPKRAEAEMT